MSRKRRRKDDRHQKESNVKASWDNFFTSQVLRLFASIISLIVIIERTIAYFFYGLEKISVEFFLISAWAIALLLAAAAIFAIIGLLQDRNL